MIVKRVEALSKFQIGSFFERALVAKSWQSDKD